MQPICLPGSLENLAENSTSFLVGWGSFNVDRPFQNRIWLKGILHEVSLPIIGNERCQDIMKDLIKIEDKHICAGGVPNKDSCNVSNHLGLGTFQRQTRNLSYFQGDSGGGLVTINTANHMILSGIASGGDRKCGWGKPGFYTRVQNYVPWIEKCIEDSNNCKTVRQRRDIPIDKAENIGITDQQSGEEQDHFQLHHYLRARSRTV